MVSPPPPKQINSEMHSIITLSILRVHIEHFSLDIGPGKHKYHFDLRDINTIIP